MGMGIDMGRGIKMGTGMVMGRGWAWLERMHMDGHANEHGDKDGHGGGDEFRDGHRHEGRDWIGMGTGMGMDMVRGWAWT